MEHMGLCGGLSEDKTEYHGIIYDNIIFINGIITTNCDDPLVLFVG